MNEVTNKSANDFEALSQGITVAGSVFANAGESAQTYTALLGTVVASTQRSGSEVARGLRTIAMNIRQIKGELEDGEIVDEKSISDAAKALNSVGVAVSENGRLRKVSDVLTDLAKAWDTLTNAEQSYVASNLAGKRQANVLIALMQNFDEYEKELKNYADGAGSALRENEIYLDSWEAKTAMLKASWTEFVSNLIETDAIKGGLDLVTAGVNALNTDLGQTLLIGTALARVLDPFISKFLATGFAQGIGLTGLVGGSTLPVLGVIAGIAALIAISDKLIVSTDELADSLADVNSEYEKQFGAGSEYETLIKNTEKLTDLEQKRLMYLEAQRVELEKQKQDAQDKYDRSVLQDSRALGTGYDQYGNITSLSASEIALANLKQGYQGAFAQFEANSDINELTQSLVLLVGTGEEWYEVFTRNRDELDEDQKAWLRFYEILMAAYRGASQTASNVQKTTDVLAEQENVVEKLEEKLLAWNKSEGYVIQAQKELNEQGFISVATMDELAEVYPDILKSVSQLANGYGVEENALYDLISAKETDARVMIYNARTAAVEYINSQRNMAIATNATTKEIIDQLTAQMNLAEGGAISYEQFSEFSRLRNNLRSMEEIERFFNTGAAASGSSSSSSENTVLNGINDFYDIKKRGIWLAEQQGDVATQTRLYVSLQKWAADEAAKLRKQGYADTSDEIYKLQQIWWEAQNWVDKQAEQNAKDLADNVNTLLSDAKDGLDSITDRLDAQADKIGALVDLEEAYHDITTSIAKEQSNINTQLKTAKESYQYLDEETRKMLFNEKDYAILSRKLQDISAESASIYEQYQQSINSLTQDNIYLADELTSEFEKQFEAKKKEYEIVKAELELAKAQSNLQNAQNERNTMMLVNGVFQWVADPKAVKEAIEKYSDAEEEYADAVNEAAYTRKINELKASKQAIETEKAKLNAEYAAMEESWKQITDSIQNPSKDIASVLKDISENATPQLRAQIYATAELLSQLTGASKTTIQGASGGGTVQAMSNGNAPSGLGVGTVVTTHGGTYQIVSAGTPGASYNASSGYYSIKLNDKATYDSGGIAYGRGILLKDTAMAEGVLKPALTANILDPQKNKMFETFVSGITTLLDGDMLRRATSGRANGLSAALAGTTVYDNSVTVNGMEITGKNADILAETARAILPIHTGRR